MMAKADLRYRKDAASGRHFIPGAQCSGLQRFEYAFVPYRCQPVSRAPFASEAASFLCPVIGHQVGTGGNAPAGEGRPADLSPFLSLRPDNLVVSCFKRAADGQGYILRLWENEGRETQAELALPVRFDRVFRCDLTEDVIEELELIRTAPPEDGGLPEQGVVTLKVSPYKIITLRLSGTGAGCCQRRR